MRTYLEQRVWRLEKDLALLQQQVASLQSEVAQLNQQGWTVSGGYPWMQSPTSAGGYYGCLTTADLPAGSGTTPTALANQTVWQLKSGARTNLSGTYTIYNDTGSDVPSGSQAILAANPDDTYTVVSVACTANT